MTRILNLLLALVWAGCQNDAASRWQVGDDETSITCMAGPSDTAASRDADVLPGEADCVEEGAQLVSFDAVMRTRVEAPEGAPAARSATDFMRTALIREMKYALSPTRMDGTSTCHLTTGSGTWTLTDTDYVNHTGLYPTNAKKYLSALYGTANTGKYGGQGPHCNEPGNRWSYYGGYCKIFIDTLISRAGGMHAPSSGTTWIPNYRLPTYAAMTVEALNSDVQAGDVLVDRAAPHIVMVYAILARDGSGRPTSIDVVDSNYTSAFTIAKHKLEGATLARYSRMTNLLRP